MIFSLGKRRDGFIEEGVWVGPGKMGKAVPEGGEAMNKGSEDQSMPA